MLEKLKEKLNKIKEGKEDNKAVAYNISKDETSGGGSGGNEESYPWWKNLLDFLYK